jgi:glycosyltransferase involved in cell wall biosynthesis
MISIIIPSHKETINIDLLVGRLSSFSSQVPFEILVALSPESEMDFKRETLDKADIIQCTKKGRACQMNEAAKLAKGEVLAFLHADVKPPESFLQDIQKTINDGFDAGFFSYRFDRESLPLKINSYFTAKDGIFTGGGDQCLFIKGHLFETLGRFKETQVLMEDFEFFERMKKNGIRYKIIKNDLIVSARKYEANSYLRVNLSNLLLVILFRLGYPSKKLKTIHDKLIRTPYNT